MTKESMEQVCAEVEAVFVERCGALSTPDLEAVFERLREKAGGRLPAVSPKVNVAECIPDLIHTNLDDALEQYNWSGYAPVATPDGRCIEAVIALQPDHSPPEGYIWHPGRKILLPAN